MTPGSAGADFQPWRSAVHDASRFETEKVREMSQLSASSLCSRRFANLLVNGRTSKVQLLK